MKDVEAIPFIVVGNKCDLENQRKVPTSKGKQLADEIGCLHIETSAKSGLNVGEAFYSIVRGIKKWRSENDEQVDHTTARNTKKGMCLLL